MTRRAVEELVDRCLLVGFEEAEPPQWLLRAAGGLGGVVLYGPNLRADGDVGRLSAVLHSGSDVLVAVDEEGGDVTRLHYRRGSPDPGNYVLGRADDAELTSAVAGSIGARLRAAGVGLNLAPVVDVNVDPENPVIGVRSFGADPDLVSRQSAAWVRGLQAQGVAACAKHFPGHGDTRVDSHLGLPQVNCDEAQWRAVHLPPFAAALAAGVRAVMTAHLRMPALDDRPATTSRRILTDLLRGELGFDGAVVTDALDMGAVAKEGGAAGAAVRALAAGADALCLGGTGALATYHQVRSAVTSAVLAGDLSVARLSEAADRVGQLRAWIARAAVQPSAEPSSAGGRGAVGQPAGGGLGVSAVRRTVLFNRVVPLAAPPVVIELRAAPNLAVGDASWDLAGALAGLGCEPRRVVRLAGSAGDVASAARSDAAPAGTGLDAALAGMGLDAALAGADGPLGAPVVVVGRDVSRQPGQRAVWERVLEVRPDAVLVDVGLPRPEVLGGAAYVLVGGAARPNLQVAAEVLVHGGICDVTGGQRLTAGS